jgi:hypothetical protein
MFLSNPLYISGDSYSGMTVPIILQEVLNGNLFASLLITSLIYILEVIIFPKTLILLLAELWILRNQGEYTSI